MKTFLAIIFLAFFSSSLIAEEGEKLIFSENFSGSPAPGVKTENGRSYKSGAEFDINYNYNGCRYWGDVELRYSMRFPKQLPKHYCVSVKDRGWREKPKYMLYYISFNAEGLSFYAHNLDKDVQDKKGNFKFKDAGFDGFKPDVWYRFVIRCEKDRLKISIGEEGGKLIQICDAEVFPGGGGVRIFSYDRNWKVNENPFDITDIEVVELSPAPKPQKK